MNLLIGLCGFSMSMKTYGLHFPVVEVQNTFYEPPADATLMKWRAITPPSLEYSIKVWQLVTHAAKSPTYRRMKRQLSPNENPGFFRDSPAVEEGWQRMLRETAPTEPAYVMFNNLPRVGDAKRFKRYW